MKRDLKAISKVLIVAIVVVIIVVAGAGVYFVTMSGTATTSTGPVTINFYESLAPSETSYFSNVVIPQFEQANPNIKVNFINSNDPVSAIKALVQGNSVGASIAGVDNLKVGELVYANDTMDLSSIVSTMLPSTLISSATKMVNYEKTVYNAIYFIPFRSNIPLVFYNKTAFSKAGITSPPSTTTELTTDAQKLQSSGYNGPVMFQGHGGASTPTELYQWMVQFGGNPFSFNDTGDVAAFQYLSNLSTYFSPKYTTGYWGSYVGLAKGSYQMIDYQWPYVYGILTNSTLGMTNATLGVYPGPSGPSNGNHLLGGDVLVIPKGATNLPALETFANFLLSPQAQSETLIHLSWVAVNSQAYSNLPGNVSAVGQALQQAINTGVFLRNPAPWITQWNNYADDAWTKIVVDHASSSQIQGILNSENAQLYAYLQTNYGNTVAQQYASNAYKPISVS